MGERDRKSWYICGTDSQTLLKELLAKQSAYTDPRDAGLDSHVGVSTHGNDWEGGTVDESERSGVGESDTVDELMKQAVSDHRPFVMPLLVVRLELMMVLGKMAVHRMDHAISAISAALAKPNDFIIVNGLVSVWTKGERGAYQGMQGGVNSGKFEVVEPERIGMFGICL